MVLSSLVTRTRVGGLAATLIVGGVLLAQATPAAAAPQPSTTPASTTTASGSTSGASTSGASSGASSTGASSTGSSSTGSSSGASTGTAPKPAATAPPAPTDPGPQCPGTAAAATYPVVCLPAGSGEDSTATLTPGDSLEFDAQVVNNGSAVTDAVVVITLPKGLQLESDEDDPVYRIDGWYDDEDDDGDFTDLTCTGGPTTITCDVGALATQANILVGIDLEPSAAAVVNTTQTFGVELRPAGTDTYPTSSVTGSILVLAPSHLVVSLTPATLRTVVGHRATITGTVRNAGSGAAPDAFAAAITVDAEHPRSTHFEITNGIDPTSKSGSIILTGARSATAAQARLQRQALTRAAATARSDALPSIRFWPLGTIAPGAVKQVPIELKALTLGTDTLTFGALSSSDNGECDSFGGSSGGGESGSSSESASFTSDAQAVRAAAGTTAPSDCSFLVQTRITAIPEPAALANSGTHGLDVQLGVAVWSVVLGAVLVWAGRRRRVVSGRHLG